MESIRKFILTLRFYSPRAYDYIRMKFDNNLPHPATIRKWYQQSGVQSKSGICQRSVELLKDQVRKLKNANEELYCGLVHDEMSIRQHAQWLDDKKEFSGFITFGKVSEDAETLPLATHALVFLINGINIPFHLPIAYYFIADIEGIDKVVLKTSIIEVLTNIGVKLVTSTFDGHPTNIVACDIMGSSFDLKNFHPEFKNPFNDSVVYPFLDPPHMLKLIRNHLANNKTFYDRIGRPISWKYFEELVKLKDQENFITHKMTIQHINFKKKIMNVSLATQTLSSSVAKSMRSLMERNYSAFGNAAATIEFIERMNKLFDVLNSDIQRPDNLYKSPITSETSEEIFAFLEDTTDYIKGLTLHFPFGKPVIESEIKVGFKRMLIDIANLKAIFSRFVQTNKIKEFPVRRVGQCPLESLFGRCRSHPMLGQNTNPTSSQFRAIMRKVLVNNEVTSSVHANCIDQLDILQLSSRVPPKQHSHLFENINLNDSEDANSMRADQSDHFPLDPTIENQDNLFGNDNSIDPSRDDLGSNEKIGIAFSAGQIENRIEFDRLIKCKLCHKAFSENDKLVINSFPTSKQSQIPCKNTYEICAIAHRTLGTQMIRRDFCYSEVLKSILSEVHLQSIFPKTDFASHSTHKLYLVKYIAEKYITSRANYIARKLNLENQFKQADATQRKLSDIKHYQGR